MRHTTRLGGLLLLLGAVALLLGCGGGSSGAAGGPQVTYVGLGASDAVGIGAIPFSDGYVYLIAGHLRDLGAEVTLQNLGINGAKIDQIVDEALPAAVAAQPRVVTLWTGANDVIGGRDPTAFGLALDGMLGRLEAETPALVAVGDLPDLTQAPIFRDDPDPDVTVERIAAFNAEIEAAVQAHGAVLVRLSALPLSDSLFFLDGFHPNDAGHQAIAEAYWAELAPRLLGTQ
jgi:lysophospholipase L1-like esterase